MVLLVTLVGLALAALVVVRFVLPGLATPERVAADFTVSSYEGDAATVCALAAPELLEPAFESLGVEDCSGLVAAAEEDSTLLPDNGPAADVEVLEVTMDGDTRTVRVSDPGGSPGVWVEVGLARVDGDWLVTSYSG